MTTEEILKRAKERGLTTEEAAHLHLVGEWLEYDCSGNFCNGDGTDTVYCNICGQSFKMPCVSTLDGKVQSGVIPI